MNCTTCAGPMTLVLHLVKDGTVYEAWRCPNGHHLVRDTCRNHLPVELTCADGVHVARVLCGENCFIFDRRMFRSALRGAFRACRRKGGHLLLDLSGVGLVGEGMLSFIPMLDNGLSRRGFRLQVVAASTAVKADILAAAPSMRGRIFDRETDARESLPATGGRSPGRTAAEGA